MNREYVADIGIPLFASIVSIAVLYTYPVSKASGRSAQLLLTFRESVNSVMESLFIVFSNPFFLAVVIILAAGLLVSSRGERQ